MYDNRLYLPQTVSVPMSLYKSKQGEYFDGYAGKLLFTGPDMSAWAGLFNPPDSRVNLFISSWAATSLYSNFRIQVWFNPVLPGSPDLSDRVSTTNFTLNPQPKPKVQLLYASNVKGKPEGGMEAFSFRGGPQNTIYVQENGKFIFPPGGSFALVLAHKEEPDARAEGRIAFGWYEEPVWNC